MIKKVLLILCLGLLVFHFSVLALHHLPNNPVKHQYKYQISNYVNPFFSQEWKLFAPNPANSNMTIQYQFTLYKGGDAIETSKWLDVAKPLIEHRDNNFWSPGQRVLKHFSTCILDIVDVNQRAIKVASETDSLKDDPEKTNKFVKDMISGCGGHSGVMEYSYFVYNNYKNTFENTEYDSVNVQYKIMNAIFPRFSKRKEDYFDMDNYEFKEMRSVPVKIVDRTRALNRS